MRLAAFALFGATFAGTPALVFADSNSWGLAPEQRGECGEECRTPATAFIDDAAGEYSFGVRCSGSMILAGPATMGPGFDLEQVELQIDATSYGQFNIDTGLNDYYVSAVNPDAQYRLSDDLNSGNSLSLLIPGRSPIDFTLAGSRAALQALQGTCALTAEEVIDLEQASEDYHTTYAMSPGACSSGTLIDWSYDAISGPGFQCYLGERVNVGSGLEGYESECVIDGQNVLLTAVFGLGIHPDRFSVQLEDRFFSDMYPCTPVDGLEGTN